MKDFKNILLNEDSKSDFDPKKSPHSAKLLKALQMSFENYYKTELPKIQKMFKVNASDIVLNAGMFVKNHFSENEKELIDFWHVCGKYITMAAFIKDWLGQDEAEGKYGDSFKEVYAYFDMMQSGTDGWHLRVKQTKTILADIQKNLKDIK